MPTSEEILDILLQIRATGEAEATAVNQIIGNTGNQALVAARQVDTLTVAHKGHADALQTVSGYTANYGGQLTAQEARYARLQLGSKSLAAEERSLTAEASAAARAMGALGSEGAHTLDRFAALGGVMGSGGAMGIGMGALLVGGGAALELGHSMISNAEKNTAAQRGLAQAFDSQGQILAVYQPAIDGFISKNARFISSQYEVKDAFATATRAGFTWSQTQRLVNDALDLSAAKHISLTEAAKVLIDAEHGRAIGLLDLGIAVKDIAEPEKELEKATVAATKAGQQKATADRSLAEEQVRLAEKHHVSRSELMHLEDLQKRVATTTGPQHEVALRGLKEAQVRVADSHRMTQSELMHLQDLQARATTATKDFAEANQDVSAAQQLVMDKGSRYNQILDQVEGKTRSARGNVSDLTQASNDLRNSWENISNQQGPALEEELAHVIDYVNHNAIPAFEQLDSLVAQLGGGPNGPGLGVQAGKDTRAWLGQQVDAAEKWLSQHGVQARAMVPSDDRSGPVWHPVPQVTVHAPVVINNPTDPEATGQAVSRHINQHIHDLLDA